MTDHSLHSRKYFASFFCFLSFAAILLTFPIQSIAQTRSPQRERKVQIFFAYNPTRPIAQQEVQFLDFSRGNPTSWLWDFGDGETSILQNPGHTYATPGSYRVSLTARNNSSSGKVSRTLNVILSSFASFTYTPPYPVTGQAVQFTDTSTGGPTSWQWNFGDGTSSTSQNPSHTYTTAGSYTVTLTVAFSTGSKSVSHTVTVALSLAASFTYTPTSPAAGQPVQFTDTSTGSPISWQWSFGDGITSNSQNPTHTYATAATYTVTLTVAYSSGSRSASQTITVLPPSALSASFTYSPSSPVAGQAVQFTDTSTGNPTSWLWNFGDNTTSTSKNPSHTYATAATYTVTLTATNSTASKSTSQTIIVSSASTLIASFTYSPSSPAAGQVVYFTDTSTGSPTSWQWGFGDGATSTSRNASHAYTTAASYTVTLTVANSSGSKSASQTVIVLPTFAASFTYSPSSPAPGQAVQFTDASSGSPTSWQWNFGDNSTSAVQNPSHTYAAVGQYWVNLIITKGADSHSASQLITVGQPGIITAASPSFEDVSAAIYAADSGDTVIVPAGTATWSSNLVLTKGIYLIGAGIGNTVITSNYTATGGSDQDATGSYLVVYNPSTPANNDPFRLSGFTFNLASKCGGVQLRNTTISPISKIRVDHNRFYNIGTPGIWCYVKGTVYGVADNNIGEGGYVRCNGLNATTWLNFNFAFGSADNFYFEDNTMSYTGVFYNECGARFCGRYNSITITGDAYPLVDMHGLGGTAELDTMGGEFYNNTINMGTHSSTILDQRSGRALVYNNAITTSGTATMKMREEEIDSKYTPTTSPNGQPRHVSDSYYWGNTRNGGLITEYYISGTINYGSPDGIVPRFNVHVWAEQDLNNKYTFNGTVGVGYGLLSARPATCTTGVGYWATDTNTFYKATGTNVWTEYYRPYPYPHPLRNIL